MWVHSHAFKSFAEPSTPIPIPRLRARSNDIDPPRMMPAAARTDAPTRGLSRRPPSCRWRAGASTGRRLRCVRRHGCRRRPYGFLSDALAGGGDFRLGAGGAATARSRSVGPPASNSRTYPATISGRIPSEKRSERRSRTPAASTAYSQAPISTPKAKPTRRYALHNRVAR